MSYGHAATAYREREILSATPERLVVIIFDHLLVNLRRARLAMDSGNLEMRADALSKAGDAVMELLVSTDVERGGALASQLRSLYTFTFNELLGMGIRPDVIKLDRITEMMSGLRDAFATVITETAKVPAA